MLNEHSWFTLFRERVGTALTGGSSGSRGTLPVDHLVRGARYACIASSMFHLNSLKSFPDDPRTHYLYFPPLSSGVSLLQICKSFNSTTAGLILLLWKEQPKSSKILLLGVINPKKRSWMFFHTQLMPPVLGYYRRHHFYVMHGANNDKGGVDDRCGWKEDGNGRKIVGFWVGAHRARRARACQGREGQRSSPR